MATATRTRSRKTKKRQRRTTGPAGYRTHLQRHANGEVKTPPLPKAYGLTPEQARALRAEVVGAGAVGTPATPPPAPPREPDPEDKLLHHVASDEVAQLAPGDEQIVHEGIAHVVRERRAALAAAEALARRYGVEVPR